MDKQGILEVGSIFQRYEEEIEFLNRRSNFSGFPKYMETHFERYGHGINLMNKWDFWQILRQGKLNFVNVFV